MAQEENIIPQKSFKELVKDEFYKCASDPVYFCKKYYYIQHPQRGRMLFNLYPFQETLLRRFQKGEWSIINKSRQLGISTLVSAFSLWLMLFHKDKNILVLATTQDTAKNLITKVRFSYDQLPSWLRLKDTENNKLLLKLVNGSQIQAKPATDNASRSEAVTLLVIDEAAFIDNIERIFTGAQQTLATGGSCIALSSPNGTGNWFYKEFTKAQEKLNSFVPLKLPWTVHPERDQTWRDQQDRDLGVKHAAQECFSGDTIVYTKLGPKYIKDIQEGDIVLSHDGTFNKVLKTFNHIEENNLYEIKNGINNIQKYTTGNHPFLNIVNKWTTVESIYDHNQYIQLFPTNINQYDNPSKIDLLDYIKVNNPQYFPLKSNDESIWINKKSYVHRHIEFDYELGFIIGCFLSEGSYWNNVVSFSYNGETESEEHSWPLILQNYINKKFNISIFSHYLSKRDKGANLYVKNQIFLKFIELCIDGGKYCQDKHISSFVWENSNKETLKGILDGIMVGDGMLKSDYNCKLGLTSERLVYDSLYISNLLGLYNTTISINKKEGTNIILGKEYQCKNSTILTYSNTKIDSNEKIFSKRIKNYNTVVNNRKTTKFMIDNGIPLTILQLNPSSEKIQVYNFEVENTHTYVTEYGIVHNCDADFITSGESVIDTDVLNYYTKNIAREPLERRGLNGEYWIFDVPDYSRSYALIADVARGDGADSSTFHVFDIELCRQVAEFKSQLPTKDFANVIHAACVEWNNALCVIENASIGWDVVGRMIDKEYKNLYYSPKIDNPVDSEQYLSKYNSNVGMVPGFSMTQKTRPLVISKLISYMNEYSVDIFSKRALEEIRTFIYKNGRPQAQQGHNDDLVLPIGIFLFLRETTLMYQKQSEELSRAVLNGFTSVNYTTPAVYNNPYEQNPYRMQDGHGGVEDLTWLLG